MEEIVLYRGTSKNELVDSLNGKFSDVSWWTTNIKNLSHYYDGACIEINLIVNKEVEKEYIKDRTELTPDYTFGGAEMSCPKDSIWYSISKAYMETGVAILKEIKPIFNDDDDDC